MRAWRRWPTLVAVVIIVIFVASGSTAPAVAEVGQSVPVTGCPAYMDPPRPVPEVPATVALPSAVLVAPGTMVFGTGDDEPPTPMVLLSAGPSGSSCQAGEGADGGFSIDLTGPRSAGVSVHLTLSPGGDVRTQLWACPYVPAARDAVAWDQSAATDCARPSTETVTQIKTGSNGLDAALVIAPRGVSDPHLATSGSATGQTIALFVATVDRQGVRASQSGECTLPETQSTICLEALELFVTESIASTNSQPLLDALGLALSGSPADALTPSKPRADCYDATAFSGVDSRPEADYCAAATSAAGYSSASHHNATARDAAERLPSDAVIYITGHSWGGCPTPHGPPVTPVPNSVPASAYYYGPPGGVGMVFWNDTTKEASFFRGPADAPCFADITYVQGEDNVPWPQHSPSAFDFAESTTIGHAAFVVLQACDTALDQGGYESIAHQVADAGAANVLGFTDLVAFAGSWGQYGPVSHYRPGGDMWAYAFWRAFGQEGKTIYEAQDEALGMLRKFGGVTWGYDSAKFFHRAGSPVRLAPSQGGG